MECEYVRASTEELHTDCIELLDPLFAVHLCGKSHKTCPVYSNGLQTLHILRVRRIKLVKKGTEEVRITSRGARAAPRESAKRREGLGPAGVRSLLGDLMQGLAQRPGPWLRMPDGSEINCVEMFFRVSVTALSFQ
jgi:hypothetical protein